MPRRRPGASPVSAQEIVDKLPHPVWALRWEQPPDLASFRVVSGNAAAARSFGVALEDVVGTTLAESFPDLMQTQVPALLAEVLRDGVTRHTRRVRRSGDSDREQVFNLTIFCIQENVVGSMMEDITDQWQSEEQQRVDEGLIARAEQAAHVGTFRWEAADDRMTWSDEMYRIFGVRRENFDGTLEGMLAYVTDDDRDSFRSALKEALRTRDSFRLRKHIRRPDGAERVLECVGVTDTDAQNHVVGLHGVSVDVSEREGARRDSRESEERFHLLVDRVKDYAIFMLDPSGHIATWNEGAKRIKQYDASEIIGQHISRFYTPEDIERGRPAQLLAAAEKDGSVEDEGWRVRKDGTRIWADVVITALRDEQGQLRGFAKVTRDLTERRQAELALAELSGRLLQIQDDERRRIARELHDSTSPLLTGMVAKLYNLRQKLDKDPAVRPLIDDALSSAEAVNTVLRSVSSLLHPPLLDESGLVASLKWYVNAFSGRNDIRVELQFPPRIQRLERDTEIALFRIVQEGLNNVMRNLGVKQVVIRMHRDGELVLELVGKGRDLPPSTLADLRAGRGDTGIGVAGMRERIRKLGGRLEVTIEEGALRITCILPLENGESHEQPLKARA